jgi:ubiquinone/menaquinone biosynthesis C-methylase UbiE
VSISVNPWFEVSFLVPACPFRKNMVEFDRFSREYKEIHNRNIAIGGEQTDFFARLKLRLMRDILKEDADSEFSLLDVGSGIGKIQQSIFEMFPRCRSMAIDVSLPSLKMAKETAQGEHLFVAYNGKDFPFKSGQFDVVLFCTVLHHIPAADRAALFAEAARTLKPGGRFFVFEHNPYNPLTRHVVNTCEFDDDAVLINPRNCRRLMIDTGVMPELTKYYFFFPNVLKFMRFIEKYMGWLPLGGQYFVLGVNP